MVSSHDITDGTRLNISLLTLHLSDQKLQKTLLEFVFGSSTVGYCRNMVVQHGSLCVGRTCFLCRYKRFIQRYWKHNESIFLHGYINLGLCIPFVEHLPLMNSVDPLFINISRFMSEWPISSNRILLVSFTCFCLSRQGHRGELQEAKTGFKQS